MFKTNKKWIVIDNNGKLLRIRFSKKFPNKIRLSKPSSILIKFTNEEMEGCAYYVTKSKFTTIEEIIQHFIENQTSDHLEVVVKDIVREEGL